MIGLRTGGVAAFCTAAGSVTNQRNRCLIGVKGIVAQGFTHTLADNLCQVGMFTKRPGIVECPAIAMGDVAIQSRFRRDYGCGKVTPGSKYRHDHHLIGLYGVQYLTQ